MEKLFIFVLAMLFCVASVAFSETVSTIKVILDPGVILKTWVQGNDPNPDGYFRCFPGTPIPNESMIAHIHRDKFYNPDKSAHPPWVVMYFDADTKQVYSIIWEEGGSKAVFIWCGGRFVQNTGGPSCP